MMHFCQLALNQTEQLASLCFHTGASSTSLSVPLLYAIAASSFEIWLSEVWRQDTKLADEDSLITCQQSIAYTLRDVLVPSVHLFAERAMGMNPDIIKF